MIYDDNAAGGPYFLVKGEDETAINEKQFSEAQLAYEKGKSFVNYNSLYTWHNGETASPVYPAGTGDGSSHQKPGTQSVSPHSGAERLRGRGYFSARTLYDLQTGVPTAKVLVPSGRDDEVIKLFQRKRPACGDNLSACHFVSPDSFNALSI
ncbi:MAG: hypothetical protein K6C08_02950 [Oscillospiraceae bacterium]|nr:hypothetical protein [Oscillospiraceae bacterium]